MIVNFEKWHGCKNDFIVVALPEHQESLVIPALQRAAPGLCSRQGDGIGADGILVWRDTRDLGTGPIGLTIINMDGSIAKNCGNGLRVVAGSVYQAAQARSKQARDLEWIEFRVEGASKIARLLKSTREGSYWSVQMGQALLNEALGELWPKAKGFISERLRALGLGSLTFSIGDIGNLHVVFEVDKATEELLKVLGSDLQKSPHWDGINVHLKEPLEPTSQDQKSAKDVLQAPLAELLRAVTWERGVGPTQACGSGACVLAASAAAGGFVSDGQWVGVQMPGGRLYVSSQDGGYTLAGPAVQVFTGQRDL